ncbi:MAG: hypothetical protein CMI95_00615 [Pelagibacteraceae bacterium]|nr:hypothetical protein [Pelagibacteraceae bacterium]PPR51720.1 MAG: Ubiquinone/menaquinone biosynthesis C-methyltransferase UbiE [Alphaproteobacteria bacterium MarineAlpha5_Bin10]|tara:strand:- start:119 stop:745 length:627 start_codon:yes stop_codon:yes gene_type:complete
MTKKDVDNKLPIYKLNSKEKVIEYYKNWTSNFKYNQDMIDWDYTGPQNAAKMFSKYASNKSISILDAGCGTGLVAKELLKQGYSNFIGVDFSKNMLELVPKDLYQKLELIDLNNPLKYIDNYFDAIICVGTFTYGHVKSHALDEFIRILKKNGLICFSVNEGIYKKYKFDKKIQELESKNKLKILELKKLTYIVNKDVEAWFCVARKL